MTRDLSALVLSMSLPLWAHAHEGHGQPAASHWHASDTLGLLVMAVAVALLVHAGRRK